MVIRPHHLDSSSMSQSFMAHEFVPLLPRLTAPFLSFTDSRLIWYCRVNDSQLRSCLSQTHGLSGIVFSTHLSTVHFCPPKQFQSVTVQSSYIIYDISEITHLDASCVSISVVSCLCVHHNHFVPYLFIHLYIK